MERRTKKEKEWINKFRVDWAEDSLGLWSVKYFEVEDKSIENLRLALHGRPCIPGTYSKLVHQHRGIIMSDTTAEALDHYEAYQQAKGRVLINGLGLGCFLRIILTKPEVTHVDVVEIDKDVIGLVGRYFFSDERVTIHCANAFTYEWGRKKWDVVWHDIWDSICTDNWKEMQKLRAKFAKHCSWQSCWSETEVARLYIGS